MIDRATKLRWRRKIRRGQYKVEDMTQTADEGLEKHFIKRLLRLLSVKRFVFGWVALMLLLIAGLVLQTRYLSHYYQSLQPTPGGVFTEGVIGSFTNANPLYASGPVDNSVSKLVFSGLLKYDQDNHLIGDLAESWTKDERESLYTVKLRSNLKWHNGQPLTAHDVVFTFATIQNPDAKSPLFSSWQGIKIEAVDDLTVTFLLPSAYSAFGHSLTTGIIPKHLLQNIPAAQLRSVVFNTTNPIGTGPFKWQAIEVSGSGNVLERAQSIGFIPNENYHLGKPKLSQFVIKTFKDERTLMDSLKNREINAAAGADSTADDVRQDKSITEYNVPLTGAVFAFFKTSGDILKDGGVRRALVLAANTKEVIGALGYPVIVVNEPILKNQVGYSRDLAQTSYNPEEANKLLDALGWVRDAQSSVRSKNGQKLELKLFSQSSQEYTTVTQILQKQWELAGVDLQVVLLPDQDLQSNITSHGYDILVYGISVGSDPDVFAYWHSSQADPRSPNRLNFSEYKSTPADQSLEAGRTRSDPALRVVKYRPFLEAWRNDNPALALYQPRFLYLVREPLFNFRPTNFNQGADRYNNVNNWMVREAKAQK